MLDIPREVGLEDDVHAARLAHLPLHGQRELLRDEAAAAVGADHVPGAYGVFGAAGPVAQGGGHAVRVLFEVDQLGVEPDHGSPPGRVGQEDRLQVGLREVDHPARALGRVLGQALVRGAPGTDAADLVAEERRGEDGVAHQLARCALLQGLLLDSQVAEDLHRALVGDVGAWGVREPPVLGDQVGAYPVGRQQQGRGTAGGAAADDEDVGVVVLLRRAHAVSVKLRQKP